MLMGTTALPAGLAIATAAPAQIKIGIGGVEPVCYYGYAPEA
jgi:hypothetical protein